MHPIPRKWNQAQGCTPIQKFLFKWVCCAHCHCALPDDGNLMGQCSIWFHSGCKNGDFKHPEWKCRKCIRRAEETRKWREAQQKERAECLPNFVKHLGNTVITFGRELPPSEDAVSFLNVKQSNECTGQRLSQVRFGITYSIAEFLFIVIFHEANNDKLTVFKTLIHKMVHTIMYKWNIKGNHMEKSTEVLAMKFPRNCKASFMNSKNHTAI